MRSLFCPAILLGALVLSGCARDQATSAFDPAYSGADAGAATAPASDSQLIVTPDEGLNGKVSSVNLDKRFVVLTFPVGQMPAVNLQLNLYRGGLKVGVVNVTGPQREDSIVADIVTGEASLGDDARDK